MEISSTRADHHLKSDPEFVPGNFDAARTGRGASLEQIVAKFYTISAAFLGRYRSVH